MDDQNRKLYKSLLQSSQLKGCNLEALSVLQETNLSEFDEEERVRLAKLILDFSSRVENGTFHNSIIDCGGGKAISNPDQPVTNVFILTHDLPFVVDSTRMIFKKMGYRVRHMLNAVQVDAKVLGIQSDEALSMLWFELDWFGHDENFSLLEDKIAGVLYDVFQAVRDWRAMQDKLREVVTTWRDNKPKSGMSAENLAESLAFIDWIIEYFTFIGSRSYTLEQNGQAPILRLVEDSGLGVLSDEPHSQTKQYVQVLPNQLEQQDSEVPYFYLSKTRTASTIHRPTYTDLLVLRKFSSTGEIIGEMRLIGLLTSDAYESNPMNIPFIRRKVEGVLHYADLQSRFLNKSLLYIIKTFPREELFQASFSELARMTLGALTLYDRPKVRLFIRKDVMNHFFSVVLYLPRERYSTDLVQKINHYLCGYFSGNDIIHQPFFSESNLVRIYFVIQPDSLQTIDFNEKEIEQHISAMAQSWSDNFLSELINVYEYAKAKSMFSLYSKAMGVGYQERYSPAIAVKDIKYIEAVKDESIAIAVYRPIRGKDLLGIKLFQRDVEQVELSDIFPVLSSMNLRVLQESTSQIKFPNMLTLHVADLHCEVLSGGLGDISLLKPYIKDYLFEVFKGRTMADGFGGLAISSKFTPRKIELIRVYAMYLRQINYSLELTTIQAAFALYPQLVVKLFELFSLRFSPKNRDDAAYQVVRSELISALADVPLLDHDRVFRMYVKLIDHTLRTNYYQYSTGPIAIKIATRRIPEAPKPAPMLEVFVYGLEVEGVHLRHAKVARGGLRWSSRQDDYRTEVLGLMKAQQVKNCIIVPSGAKGGFIAKLVTLADSPDDMVEKGKAAYKSFINCLLDITDNLVDGVVCHPENVECHDEDDPYFVVAADKGTATFSDIANQIANDRGFWLGDAFASGGSYGYDHKKIGITAKGAWESVKWHFLTMGKKKNETFTVAGIGDMSGDVFGNGMLLSNRIKLVAAFNHRHIFIDPHPDPAASFKERERLFKLSRSQWSDYNEQIISAGGGVYSRSSKHIELSEQAMSVLGIDQKTLSPNRLIQEILKAPVDLLWNGGIGTYVKADSEKNSEVGDFANNLCRVNADQLRCKVVSEGGNLGLTQLARIQYAQNGGAINTDFVDNSAGVDCSDHEVNIKIGFEQAIRKNLLTSERRNELLESMTDNVSELVLTHNFEQNVGLSLAQKSMARHVDSYLYFIETFESRGALDAQLEYLPNRELVQSRQSRNVPAFTRPELSVLVAYSKIIFSDRIMQEKMPEDAYWRSYVLNLFPALCVEHFADTFAQHPLSKEMIAMSVSSQMIDLTGITFAHHLVDGNGFSVSDVVGAFIATREIFEIDKWRSKLFDLVDVLGYEVVEAELAVLGRVVRKGMRWLLFNSIDLRDIQATIEHFSLVRSLLPNITPFLPSYASEKADLVKEAYSSSLSQNDLDALSAVINWPQALEIVHRASLRGVDHLKGPEVYYAISNTLSLDAVRRHLMGLVPENQWDVYEKQYLDRELDQCVGQLMSIICYDNAQNAQAELGEKVVNDWFARHNGLLVQWLATVDAIKSSSLISFTMLASSVRSLVLMIDRLED